MVESYTYFGFVGKYLLVDSRFFAALSLSVAFFLNSERFRKRNLLDFISRLIFRVNRVVFPVLLVVYLLMIFLESWKYANYVFSTYHLQPGNFSYLVVFSFGLFAAKNLGERRMRKTSLNLVTVFVVAFLFLDNFAITSHQVVSTDLFILLHPRATYEQKMQNYWGFFYEYVGFVKANSPKNSTILIPPQEPPWQETGHGALVRYFLHPRKIVQGTYNGKIDTKTVDYVMLAWGELPGLSSDKYGWPKVPIAIEKVVYLDTNSRLWGLIKVKK